MLLVLAGGIVALLNHQEEMARIRLERERQEFFQRRERCKDIIPNLTDFSVWNGG